MQPFFGLAQIVGGAPRHDFFAMIEEGFERLFEIQQLGLAVDDGEHIDAEGILQRGVLVKLIDDDLGDRVAF